MNEVVSLILLVAPPAIVLGVYLFLSSRGLARKQPDELDVGRPEELVDGEHPLQPEP